MKKRILILSLAFIFAGLFVSLAFCQRSSEKAKNSLRGGSLVYTANLSLSFTFRHNRSGYWYLTANSGSAVIYDSDMASGQPVCFGSALLLYNLPAEVVSALKEHPELKVRLERPSQLSCIDFDFFNYAYAGPGTLAMELHISPVISSSETLNNYVQGLDTVIPLIDYSYGNNIYIVYPLVGESSFAQGFYSSSDPSWISSPLVHPSQIKDSSGHFRSGVTINVNGLNVSASLYTIGRKGALPMEDAVMLSFNCPIRLVFYLPGDDEPWTPYIPGEDFVLPPWWTGEIQPEKPFTLKIHRKR
ncbi:MAG: hypothetical protein J5528_03345 [Firmicutes bacterium]|nr:hypothetical protein [Bacillota bacterium]